MPDWDTRLEIKVNDDVATPIDQFQATVNTPTTVIHSIEADNVGMIRQPQTATFQFTLKAIGTTVATLTRMALDGETFEIQVSERSGDDWTFQKILFRECVVTSVTPSTVTPEGVPTATVNGNILGFQGAGDFEF